MAKLRTHYDNLKVTRDAPEQVIWAAHQVLIAKYAVDAEILRIINRSYGILSDPIKRAEHDRWITEAEADPAFAPPIFQQVEEHSLYKRLARCGKWMLSNGYWTGTALIIAILVGSALMFSGKPTIKTEAVVASSGTVSAPPSPQMLQAVPAPQPTFQEFQAVPAPPPRVLHAIPMPEHADPQVVVDSHPAPTRTLREPYRRPPLAPNGQPWPDVSAYLLDQVEDGNSLVTVDNVQNGSDMVVELFDLRRSPPVDVRAIFLRGRERFVLRGIKAGNYDVRYWNLDSGAIRKSEPLEIGENEDDSLTLYTVPSGNSQSFVISQNEFDSSFLRGLPRRSVSGQ